MHVRLPSRKLEPPIDRELEPQLCILPLAHPLTRKPILNKKQIEQDTAVDGAEM
jgi:hypothetical protein